MTALLTDNLPLLAGAPNGIKKLRELILELAVRGKLVPQDPEDLSARTGLDASRTERAKAMLEGKIKKEKPAMEVADSEQPFELPDGWAWCRIVDTGNYINGLAFKPGDWSSMGRPIIRIQNLSGRSAEFNRTEREVDASVVVNPGDILVSWSATLDAFIWRGEQGVLNQHIFRVTPSKIVSAQYLYWLLKWAIKVLADSDHAHGLVMAHINRGPFLAQPIGLPPLTEQNKIVVKIAELMALCDRLEARQADADNAHTQLVQALLGSLTQARDAADFAQSWQRLAEHFHTLFTTESSIDALKQTLLQLAVMGKLVPQDPSDEPASSLLDRIQAAKNRLIKCGVLRKDNPLPSISGDEKKFSLPIGWEWVRLQSAIDVRDGTHNSPKSVDGLNTYPLVTSKDFHRGRINFDGAKRISEADYIEIAKRSCVERFDILFSMIGGNIGNQVMVSTDAKFGIKNVALFKYYDKALTFPFFIKLITESLAVDLQKVAIGGAQPFVGLGLLRKLVIALPPIAEQHRIVAKVDQLMALCDQLKDRLNQARQVHEHLASALVEQAVV
ncbi:restriction endonuclease subunit S [Pseudomonas fulva]|uniref:restriction endonuclease subunit S n=1 Tax=Pseudomonas fulva TaxID=47880 RepID=UPI000EE00CE8|nr:restriction endonuclease subunit S [Pseudomonas fulva]NIX91553.1 restriction endonuclease subunit S [Pseudomonas fulva]HAL69051.1 restriction endonuclease [Pseudomonas sp.]